MWRTADGIVHRNRGTPGYFIDASLRDRVDRLRDEEKVALYYQLSAVATRYLNEASASASIDSEVEARFDGLWLPDEFRLVDTSDDFLDLVVNQTDLVPDRWQVEFSSLLPDYLLDTGPSWRRWKKIARKLRLQR